MVAVKRGLDSDIIGDSDTNSEMSDSDSSDYSNEEMIQDSDSNDDTDNENDDPMEPIEDDEDELVKKIKAAKEKVCDHPPDIILEDTITDICFHPVNDLIAVGTICGDIFLYNYSGESNNLTTTHELHSDACRNIEFNENGSILYSVSSDKSIMLTDMETQKLKMFYDNAHEDSIYCIKVLNDNLFVTGDDEGVVKMWDIRQKNTIPIFSIKAATDYISDMITNAACKYLVCSSGDGALNTININARKIYVQTEEYESELTCLGLFRNETKILAGSSKGILYFYNWGEFGLHSDEYQGVKQSISCMVPVTENIVVFSGEDGVLRALHLFPNKHLGVVGQHSMNVEGLDISNNGHYIASFSHNNDIRFWNVVYFEDVEVQTKKQNKKKDLRNNLPSSKLNNASDFFAEME